MKSIRSCLVTLVFLALLTAGAYWLYQKVGSSAGPVRSLGFWSRSSSPTLTLSNGTNFPLEVVLTGPREERFNVAPGQKQARELTAGEYSVEGRVSNPSTDPFTGKWTFETGGTYDASFSRDGQTGALLVVRPAAP